LSTNLKKNWKEIQIYQTLLNQWTEHYLTLHDILCCEQNALEKRHFTELVQLTKEKNKLVKQINQPH
jgi:flagellar biosynthesis/type III secretory pathway chaperone